MTQKEKKKKFKAHMNAAYYHEKDWDRFLESIDDRESMHDTWKEWHKAYLKMKKDLISKGFVVTDIIIDIDDLNNYCKLRGIKNNGDARSQYVIGKG